MYVYILVAQSCLTLYHPMDCSPSDSSVHGVLQARIVEWEAIPFSRGIFPTQGSNPGLLLCRQILYHLSHQGSPNTCMCSVASVVSNSAWPYGLLPARLLCPWYSPRQEYLSGLPFPPPRDLPDPEMETTVSPASSAFQADSLPLSHLGSPNTCIDLLNLEYNWI